MLLIASKQAAVSQINSAKDLPAMRGFDDELRMLARRRRTQPATLTLPSGERPVVASRCCIVTSTTITILRILRITIIQSIATQSLWIGARFR